MADRSERKSRPSLVLAGGAGQKAATGQGGGTETGGQPPAAPANNPAAGITGSAAGIEGIRVLGDAKTEAQPAGLAPVKPTIPKPTPTGRKKKPSKAEDAQITSDMVASLLGVIFNLLAARMGPHWSMTKAEADAIAEPLTRILARYDLTQKAGVYGDYIALTVAVTGIIVPKVLTHSQLKGKNDHVEPVRKPDLRPVAGTGGKPNPQAAPGPKADGGSRQPVAPSGQDTPVKQHLGQILSPAY